MEYALKNADCEEIYPDTAKRVKIAHHAFITTLYPPTLPIHEDKDTDVPYEKSVAMAKKLEETGVEHQLVTAPGKNHGFEVDGLTDPVVANTLIKYWLS